MSLQWTRAQIWKNYTLLNPDIFNPTAWKIFTITTLLRWHLFIIWLNVLTVCRLCVFLSQRSEASSFHPIRDLCGTFFRSGSKCVFCEIVCPGCSDIPSTHSWDRNGTTDMDNLKTHCQLSLARRDKTNQATAIRDKYSVFIENETIREDLLRTTSTSGYVLCRNANHCRIKRPKNTNKRLSVLCEATAGEVHLANTGHKICS